jgi:hypothetical protein
MPSARPGTAASAVLLSTLLTQLGCPSMELAPLDPCTISSASIRVDQGGVSDVDLLFVIDNSNSMASEQVKLAAKLPQLIDVLTSGDRYAGREPPEGIEDTQRYFTAVSSLHIGVVSTSMGGQDEAIGSTQALKDCVGFGDDGVLLHSTQIAVDGVYVTKDDGIEGAQIGDTLLEPLPECEDIGEPPLYQRYNSDEDVTSQALATAFACVSRLGVRGCPFEQQLEAMWKAVAPSDGDDPALHVFLDGTHGHGAPAGINEGFVREDAILAVIHVSDEEDCSINQDGKALFSLSEDAVQRFGDSRSLNLRCGKYGEAEGMLWPAERYVRGLKSLKPGHEDRVIFAAIVGVPADSAGQSFDDVLAREEMRFVEAGDRPRTSCVNDSNPAQPDQAYPARRFVEVAKGFGDDAVVYSICADDFAPALELLIDRIASKLTGSCLPRQLVPDEDGLVRCEVFELLAPGVSRCDPKHGHDEETIAMTVDENGKPTPRIAYRVEQVPVLDKQPKAGAIGWYYDDFSEELESEKCAAGQHQRIAFSFGTLPNGGGAVIECFSPVARIDPDARGREAVNTRCGDVDEDVCATRSDDDFELFCSEDHTCQIACESNPDCPPGWVCGTKQASGKGPSFCQLPTCPTDDTPATE